MIELVQLFVNNILPISLIAGLGYYFKHKTGLQPRLLSQVTFNVFSPFLLFSLLTKSQLNEAEMLRMLLFTIATMAISGGLALALGRLLGLSRRMLAAVLLTVIFMNAGNYGMPVVGFAFGEIAQAYAALFYSGMVVLAYSLGTFIASLGASDAKQSVMNVVKTPAIYALPLAVLFIRQGWSLPLPLARSVEMLANATIPCMLILLGMQLHNARWEGQIKPMALSIGLRMVVGPLVAFLVAQLFGFQGAPLQAGVLQAAMPAAVLTIVLASEYDTEPAFVTVVVFFSTLLSPFILTPLMLFLGG